MFTYMSLICLLPNFAKRLACLPDPSYARPPQLDPSRDPLISPITPSPNNMGPLLSGSPPLATPLIRGGFIAPIKDPNFTPLQLFGGPLKIGSCQILAKSGFHPGDQHRTKHRFFCVSYGKHRGSYPEDFRVSIGFFRVSKKVEKVESASLHRFHRRQPLLYPYSILTLRNSSWKNATALWSFTVASGVKQ
jgi:hypothetical protein